MAEMTDRPPDQADRGGRDYEIVVNGELFTIDEQEVTWVQVVNLAYPESPFAEPLYDVTFRRAQKPREGILVEGQSVLVHKKGTAFNVVVTDRS
jgi:hypothetical protein